MHKAKKMLSLSLHQRTLLRENKLHLSWKSKKLLLHQSPTNTSKLSALMQHRWRNWKRKNAQRNKTKWERFIAKKSAKVFIFYLRSKEPSNLIQCWFMPRFNFFFSAHTIAVHGSWEKKKRWKTFSPVHFAPKKRVSERENIFLDYCGQRKTKSQYGKELRNFNARADVNRYELCWNASFFCQLEKILLHNDATSDFLMQQYLAQVRNWWRAEKNALESCA